MVKHKKLYVENNMKYMTDPMHSIYLNTFYHYENSFIKSYLEVD